MKDLAEIKRIPLMDITKGVEWKRDGYEYKCKCPFHQDRTPSLKYSPKKNMWYCFGCGAGGSVIDWVMMYDGLNFREAVEKLGGGLPETPKSVKLSDDNIKDMYVYEDRVGNELYRAAKWKGRNGKDFRQGHYAEGKFIWNLKGVRRVPYHLPELLDAEHVYFVEGEKCVEHLRQIGANATCVCGGSNGWLDAYADYFKGKNVILIPDCDEPGKKFMREVADTLCHVATVRMFEIKGSEGYDIADWVEDQRVDDESKLAKLTRMCSGLPIIKEGIDVPVFSMSMMEQDYRENVGKLMTSAFDLTKWMPSLTDDLKPFFPGDLVAVLARTSVGKSALAQNIAKAARPHPVLYFNSELSTSLFLGRQMQIENEVTLDEFRAKYYMGERLGYAGSDHIYMCPLRSLSPEVIEDVIHKSELVIGGPPTLVFCDYLQLMRGKGKTRYEMFSTIMEDLRTIANETNTVIFMLSQVKRGENDDDPTYVPIRMDDGKESGSIEQSATHVFGLWNESETEKNFAALKQTGGKRNIATTLDWDGEKLKFKPRRGML